MCRWPILTPASRVTILNSRSVYSSEVHGRNGTKSSKKPVLSTTEQQEVLVVFSSAIVEGLQLYSQILEFYNFKRYPKRNIFKCFFFFA
jgi:hypothetical protein